MVNDGTAAIQVSRQRENILPRRGQVKSDQLVSPAGPVADGRIERPMCLVIVGQRSGNGHSADHQRSHAKRVNHNCPGLFEAAGRHTPS
jgi:hypothetical protein